MIFFIDLKLMPLSLESLYSLYATKKICSIPTNFSLFKTLEKTLSKLFLPQNNLLNS